jgi:hypothetical protein
MAKERRPWGETTAAIIGALSGVFVDRVLALDKLTEHFSTPVRLFLIFLMGLAAFLGRRYYIVLDGADERHGSPEREDYDALRQALTVGGSPAIVYNRWLTVVLDKVDGFFGDAGRADKSWIARALHLETSGPRWTAPAFDRCLLLALIYPIVAVYAVWVLSGHVGVAEHALLLKPPKSEQRYPELLRATAFFSSLLCTYSYYKASGADGWRKGLLWFAGGLVFIVVSVWAGCGMAGFIFVFIGLVTLQGVGLAAGCLTGFLAIASGFANIPAAVMFTVQGIVVDVVSLAGVFVTFAGVLTLAEREAKKGKFGRFLVWLFAVGFIYCFVGAHFFSPFSSWYLSGAMLLFMGLLTLVNAPIDWLAVGFTRALLRRGLSLGGWWPFLFALLDVMVAAVLIVVLAFAMVLAIQTFDDIAVLRAGPDARILPLDQLFHGLETAPGDYEYWWVWCLLFSSMIPSILNLSIAAAAFLRGLPGLNTWILARMPSGKPVRERDRLTVVAALTGQIIVGIALTGIATYLTAAYVVPLGLPMFGAVVRDFASDLAAYNFPARVMIWLNDIAR